MSGRGLESGQHLVEELGGEPTAAEHQLPKTAHCGV